MSEQCTWAPGHTLWEALDHGHWIYSTGSQAGTESPQQWGHRPIPHSPFPISYFLYPLGMGPEEPQVPGDGTSCSEALPSSWEDVLAALEGTVSLKSSKGGAPQGTSVGEDSFPPNTSQVCSWGWWHPCWLTHVEAVSHLPLSLDEGAVLGTGPRVLSVTPSEAEVPRVQAAALGPCPAGALSSVPCSSPESFSTDPIHPLPASREVSTAHSISLSGNFS